VHLFVSEQYMAFFMFIRQRTSGLIGTTAHRLTTHITIVD